MKGYKEFDQKLYDDNDYIAKTTAAEFLNQMDYELKIPIDKQPEVYKLYDFEIFDDGCSVLVEVEVKNVWHRSGEWEGYCTIDIPSRKSKSISDLYIMFNKTLDTLAITKTVTILSSPESYKRTKYTDNESFFNVSLDKFKFYTKRNNLWIEVN